MKLVTVIVIDRLEDKVFPAKEAGKKPTTVFQFKAFETDFDGARIPCRLETYNDDVRDFLENQISDTVLHVPFVSESQYAGKSQYRVSNDILNPLS